MSPNGISLIFYAIGFVMIAVCGWRLYFGNPASKLLLHTLLPAAILILAASLISNVENRKARNKQDGTSAVKAFEIPELKIRTTESRTGVIISVYPERIGANLILLRIRLDPSRDDPHEAFITAAASDTGAWREGMRTAVAFKYYGRYKLSDNGWFVQ